MLWDDFPGRPKDSPYLLISDNFGHPITSWDDLYKPFRSLTHYSAERRPFVVVQKKCLSGALLIGYEPNASFLVFDGEVFVYAAQSGQSILVRASM